jgi:hypothetical protein
MKKGWTVLQARRTVIRIRRFANPISGKVITTIVLLV